MECVYKYYGAFGRTGSTVSEIPACVLGFCFKLASHLSATIPGFYTGILFQFVLRDDGKILKSLGAVSVGLFLLPFPGVAVNSRSVMRVVKESGIEFLVSALRDFGNALF
jgi:hypothetical protein